MIAVLTQNIYGVQPKKGKRWMAPKGLQIEILYKEPIRGSYRKRHRTPFVAAIPGVLETVRLSRNSFDYIEREENA
jgi:hypothetical protein